MSSRTKSILIVIALAIVFVPVPTRIARQTIVRFVKAPNAPVSGVKVYQSWETFGLWGGSRDESTSDACGTVQFPGRVAYGTVASRILSRLFTLIAVHASYGVQMRVEFYVDSPSRVVFPSPAFKQLEPAASGRYLDATGRYYFPQVDGGREYVSITGDFLHDAEQIIINVE